MDIKTIIDELRALHDAKMGNSVQIVMNINVMTRLSHLGHQPTSLLPDDAMEIWRTGDKALPSG